MELSFEPIAPEESVKEPHPLTPVVQALIDQAPNWGAFTFPTEEEALSTLKSLQTAGRELNVAVRKVRTEAVGKGKDAQVKLIVRIADRITRTNKPADENADENPAE